MKLQDFTGGLSTRLRPQFISLTEGQEYINIDNSVGTLKAVAKKEETETITKRFAKFFDNQWLSSDNRRFYAELLGRLYWTDGINAPGKYSNGTESNLGIAQPTTAPTTTVSFVEAPTEAKITAAAGGDLPQDYYFYRFVGFDGTYYSGVLDLHIDAGATDHNIVVRDQGWYRDGSDVLIPEVGFTSNSTFGKVKKTVNGEPEIYREALNSSTADRAITITGVDGLTYPAGGVVVFRQYKGIWRQVGILGTPTSSLVDSVFDISGNAELDINAVAPVSGTMQYFYTFYNSTDAVESGASPITDEEVVMGTVELSGLEESTDPQVTHKRIYRIGGDLTNFALVAEIPNNQPTFTDDLDDLSIVGSIAQTATFAPPLQTLNFLTEAYSMLFAATGSRLYFTPIGVPDAWPPLNFLDFGTTITGIAPTGTGLLVFTRFRTDIVLGTTPETLSQQLLSGDQGCVGSASIQVIGDFALWTTSDGICASSGNAVEVISRNKLGKFTLNPVDSVVHDETYYVLNDDGIALAYDNRFAPIYKRLDLNIEAFALADDVLYGWDNSTLLSTLFSAPKNLESMTFKSARMVEGRITEEKTYKKVYISFKGSIIVKVYINDKEVYTNQFITDLDIVKVEQFQLPHELQRGEYIQFEVTGTGEVLELEYMAGKSGTHG